MKGTRVKYVGVRWMIITLFGNGNICSSDSPSPLQTSSYGHRQLIATHLSLLLSVYLGVKLWVEAAGACVPGDALRGCNWVCGWRMSPFFFFFGGGASFLVRGSFHVQSVWHFFQAHPIRMPHRSLRAPGTKQNDDCLHLVTSNSIQAFRKICTEQRQPYEKEN